MDQRCNGALWNMEYERVCHGQIVVVCFWHIGNGMWRLVIISRLYVEKRVGVNRSQSTVRFVFLYMVDCKSRLA